MDSPCPHLPPPFQALARPGDTLVGYTLWKHSPSPGREAKGIHPLHRHQETWVPTLALLLSHRVTLNKPLIFQSAGQGRVNQCSASEEVLRLCLVGHRLGIGLAMEKELSRNRWDQPASALSAVYPYWPGFSRDLWLPLSSHWDVAFLIMFFFSKM